MMLEFFFAPSWVAICPSKHEMLFIWHCNSMFIFWQIAQIILYLSKFPRYTLDMSTGIIVTAKIYRILQNFVSISTQKISSLNFD